MIIDRWDFTPSEFEERLDLRNPGAFTTVRKRKQCRNKNSPATFFGKLYKQPIPLGN
jgi:hypothetical protein